MMMEEQKTDGAPLVNIVDQPLERIGTRMVSLSAFSYVFSQLVQYWQGKVNLTQELEAKLADAGYPIGLRFLELLSFREKNGRKETSMVAMLQFIHSTVWQSLFGKTGDGLEKSKNNVGEYYIFDNDPITNRFISVPKDLGQLSCAAFIAGIINGFLDGAEFPATVNAHTVGEKGEQRTVFIIQFEKEVLQREDGA